MADTIKCPWMLALFEHGAYRRCKSGCIIERHYVTCGGIMSFGNMDVRRFRSWTSHKHAIGGQHISTACPHRHRRWRCPHRHRAIVKKTARKNCTTYLQLYVKTGFVEDFVARCCNDTAQSQWQYIETKSTWASWRTFGVNPYITSRIHDVLIDMTGVRYLQGIQFFYLESYTNKMIGLHGSY